MDGMLSMNPMRNDMEWDCEDIGEDPISEHFHVTDSDSESVTLWESDDEDDEALVAAADAHSVDSEPEPELDPEPEPEPEPEPPSDPEPEPEQDYLTCVSCAMPYDINDVNDWNCCADCRRQRFLYS